MTSALNVTDTYSILDLNVKIDITHTNVEDLSATLINSAGARVPLFYRVGGTGDNFTATIFDDQATTPISSGTAPFTGSFVPESPLGTLANESVNGTWVLEVRDHTKGVRGTLNYWSLEVTHLASGPVNTPPIAVDDASAIDEDKSLTIDKAALLSNDSDPDGDMLSITGFGTPGNGTLVDNGDGTLTYTPKLNFNGPDTFTYTISDGNGGTDTATVTVDVIAQPDAPVAVDDAANTVETADVDVFVLKNDSDADNDPLTITMVTQPASGSVTNHETYVTFTPAATGTYTFDYTISDGNGGIDTATVEVTVSPASSETPLYVYEISFDKLRTGTYRAVFEIHADTNGNGAGDDSGVAGVEITVIFAGQTFTGTTDSNGIFTTGWVKKLSSGTNYSAEVQTLALMDYLWDQSLGYDGDADNDGLPDNILKF